MKEKNHLLIKMEGVSKKFGGISALDNVDFVVGHKEIVGLVGDNGAGKSTLIKILSGIYPPTRGKVFFEGNRVFLRSPRDSIALGIETVHQSFGGLVDVLSIERNMFMGREPVRPLLWGFLGLLDERKMREETEQVLQKIGISIRSTKMEISNLSGGQRQAVAIVRGLHFGAKLLVLDEPTAALGVIETNILLKIIGNLRKHLSVIMISHNLDHVFQVAGRLVVLSQGEKVGEKKREDTDKEEIENMISGLAT